MKNNLLFMEALAQSFDKLWTSC